MPEPALNAVAALRTEISPRLIILRVIRDQGQLPSFEPGQFAVLGLPGSSERYALADLEVPASPGEHACLPVWQPRDD